MEYLWLHACWCPCRAHTPYQVSDGGLVSLKPCPFPSTPWAFSAPTNKTNLTFTEQTNVWIVKGYLEQRLQVTRLIERCRFIILFIIFISMPRLILDSNCTVIPPHRVSVILHSSYKKQWPSDVFAPPPGYSWSCYRTQNVKTFSLMFCG